MDSEIYSRVKSSVKRLLNIDLSAYKDEQMRRRLDSWLIRTGSVNWNEYFARLKSDSGERSRFRDYLTINVTEFFRDPERWQSLRAAVLPELLKAAFEIRPGRGGLRIWSAGCSIGAETYSLAILLDELGAGRDHFILATDLDRSALQRCRGRGPYSADETRHVSAEQYRRYFEAGGPPYFVKERLARCIDFREQNLITDTFDTGFDLIVCRNVIIYFTAEVKNTLYRKFHAALRPGGVLFLGSTEIVPRPAELGFRAQGFSFYHRAG